MTTQNDLEQEQLAYLLQEEEQFTEQHPLDDYLQSDPDYSADHPLHHKVEMDMVLDAAISLDRSTLSLPEAFGTGLKSGLDFVLKR